MIIFFIDIHYPGKVMKGYEIFKKYFLIMNFCNYTLPN